MNEKLLKQILFELKKTNELLQVIASNSEQKNQICHRTDLSLWKKNLITGNYTKKSTKIKTAKSRLL